MNGFNYAEFVTGSLKNRNNIVPVNEVKLNGERTDCFRSIFLFEDELKYYVDKTGSVKGYAGKHLSDALIFDFDNESNLDSVKKEVEKFCLYLFHSFELELEYIRISFSGNKGFHVAIPFKVITDNPIPKNNFWNIYKSLAQELSEGFQFVDSSIYEMKRIIRLNNTKNSKTNLYKIPLSFNELQRLTIDDIKEIAKEPKELEQLPISEMEVNENLKELYDKWNRAKIEHPKVEVKHPQKRDEILDIMRNGANEGNRHHALIRIVGTLAERDIDFDFIFEMLKMWNSKNSPQLSEQRLYDESLEVYEKCVKNNTTDIKETPIYNLQTAAKEYEDYTKLIDKVKVTTGYNQIDKKLRGIAPGETCCILGKTSVGKSALLQNIGLNYARESKEPVLFFSMEMPITSVFERSLQIETGLSGIEIEDGYRNRSSDLSNRAEMLFSKIPNFYAITKGGLSLRLIKEYIRFAETNIYHKNTGLVLIDYLGLVKERGNDLYQQVSKVARGMKDLSKDMEVPVIYLSQVTKKYSEFDELELGAARDSGAIDEASDFVLAMWKEKDNRPEHERIEAKLRLGILKNRKGGLGYIPISMDKRSLRIAEQG